MQAFLSLYIHHCARDVNTVGHKLDAGVGLSVSVDL